MSKLKKFLYNNRYIIIMILYAGITFINIYFHEPWKDEAQSWLLAKELNFFELLGQMKYEGHPYLWYLILMPFAKLGFSYFTNNVISWIMCIIAAILIFKKAPFSGIIKTLIVFSFPMLYLFSTISRSYCLVPLFTVMCAITYKDRKEHIYRYLISLVLLANTHIVMTGMVAILLIDFFVEEIKNPNIKNKKVIIIFFIVMLLLLCSYLPILFSLNNNSEANQIVNDNSILTVIFSFIANIIYMIYYVFGSYNIYFCAIVIIVFINIYIIAFKKTPKYAMYSLLSIIFQIMIYAVFWYVNVQRANLVLFIIMFFVWIYKDNYNENENEKNSKVIKAILISFLIINIVFGIYNICLDINYDYSKAYNAANFIKENIEKDSTFISLDVGGVTAILPYTEDYNFWSLTQEEYFKFSIWNRNWNKNISSIEEFNNKIKNNFSSIDKLYIINSKSTLDYQENYNDILEYLVDCDYIEKIYDSDEAIVSDENYEIYKVEVPFWNN